MEITSELKRTKAEQFAESLADSFNKASLTMMISMGHRTGLFDTMEDMPPSDSQTIAEKSGLHERYVREWLGAMVAGGIIELHKGNRYILPEEHAASLTRSAGPGNLAVFAEFIFSLAENGEKVLQCFRQGGGIQYDHFHRFYHAMDEDQSIIATFFDQFLPQSPELLKALREGIQVLDAGCGTGGLLIRLAAEFPKSHFTGLDLTDFAIEMAKKNAREKGLNNVIFETRDLSDFDKSAPVDKFDFVMTIDAIHDQQKPIHVLKGMYRSLRKKGWYLMVDINGSGHIHDDMQNPFAPMLYTISCMHCVPVSIGQGGEGLGAMWGEEKIRAYLREAGFTTITKHSFDSDPLNHWFILQK